MSLITLQSAGPIKKVIIHEDALDLTLRFFIIHETDPITFAYMMPYLTRSNTITPILKMNNFTQKLVNEYRHEVFNKAHLFLPQIIALYSADQTMMNHYICDSYGFDHPQDIITKKLTPLHAAVCENNVAMMELLLLNSEDTINDADCLGLTPLSYATATDISLEITALLLGCKNIQANKRPKNGITPFYCAVAKGKQPLIELFLSHPNFNVNEADDDLFTPLHKAATSNRVKVAKFLLQHKAFVDCADKDGVTPLMMASQKGHIGMLKLLLNHGADPTLATPKGISALDVAYNEKTEDYLATELAFLDSR